MPELTEYRLTFRSGYHLGTRGVNLEESGVVIPSDTLFAALVDAFARGGGDPEDLVALFPGADGGASGDPPFLLTSAFPFAGAVRFFPMPVPLQRFFTEEMLKERRKELKRVRFVSESLFRRMLEGETMDGWLFPESEQAEPATGVALQRGIFWLTVEEVAGLPKSMRRPSGRRHALRYVRVYAVQQTPRVAVDRVSSASDIFHTGRVSLAPYCGLWFGVAWRRPEVPVGEREVTVSQAFGQALALLQDDGLGGERSAGYGAFDCVETGASIILSDPRPGGLALLLSRYRPRQAELPDALTGNGTSYALTSVAGWLRSWGAASQRRRRLWLVDVGGIVRTVGLGPWGDLVDVRPIYSSPAGELPHPVWRYGLALGAGLKEVRHA